MGVGNRDEQIMQTQHRQQELHLQQQVHEQPVWQEYRPPVVEGSKELRKQSRNQRLFEQWSKLTAEQQAELRAKSEYIHGHVENKDQIIHAPHAKSHTIKRMNEVITSVLGDQVYDNITRIKTGESEEQRTVKLHHSRGTKLVSQGKTVFKFDLVGSGFKQWRRHGIIRDVVKAWFQENQNVDQLNQQSEEAHDRLDDISPELLEFRLCHALTKKELYFLKDRLHAIQQLCRREKLWE